MSIIDKVLQTSANQVTTAQHSMLYISQSLVCWEQHWNLSWTHHCVQSFLLKIPPTWCLYPGENKRGFQTLFCSTSRLGPSLWRQKALEWLGREREKERERGEGVRVPWQGEREKVGRSWDAGALWWVAGSNNSDETYWRCHMSHTLQRRWKTVLYEALLIGPFKPGFREQHQGSPVALEKA